MAPDNELLRSLPQVEEILSSEQLASVIERLPRELAADAVRAAIDSVRQGVLAGTISHVDTASIIADAKLRLLSLEQPTLRRVVNASGVVIHTNLGRSPLAQAAIDAVNDVIAGYSTLEYSTEKMGRGSRHDHCEKLICALTGAEAAIAVNNNAAAVMMVLTQFASGHSAIVSRGEEVEIGGAFRIPDIMAQSGAVMVEVGATNKTHAADYRDAITDETSLLLKVHRSNFRLIGFTEEVDVAGLRALADEANAAREKDKPRVLVYEDQGSGAFTRLECFGEYAEPTVSQSLAAGADIVSFSGDKLLGGPQAGIIVGRKELIDQLKAHPLARALRLDKMTLAALEATLRLYLHPEQAKAQIPVLRMLTATAAELKPQAEDLAAKMAAALPQDCCSVEVIPETSRAGGGALPMCDIPTWCVALTFKRGCAQECERHLIQEHNTPVVARIGREQLLIDVRTLLNEDERLEVMLACAEYFSTLS